MRRPSGFGAMSAASSRICRNGAIMFGLLLAIPMLPLEDRSWLLWVLLALLVILFGLVLHDVIELRSGGDPQGPGVGAVHRRNQAPRVLPDQFEDWEWNESPAVPVSTPSRPREPEPLPARPDERITGLRLDTADCRNGFVELVVRAGDSTATASTRIREPLENILRFGDSLRGFPSDGFDRRDLSLGSFDPERTGGGIRLLLFSRDDTWRAYVTIWPDVRSTADARQTSSIAFAFDPADLRGFADSLVIAPLTPGGSATLRDPSAS